MSDPTTEPTAVDLKDSQRVFSVSWGDGKRTVVGYKDLRCACRCAGCVDELTGKRTLNPDLVPATIGIDTVEPVGHYGIRFDWSDGHGTGIYTWERLRQLGAE